MDTIKCPVCNENLHSITRENQKIDSCLKCGGIWFDKGELQEVVESLISKDKVDFETIKETYFRKAINIYRQKHPLRQCPRCHVDLQVFNYCYDSNVFLDKCWICGSIWADEDEVRRVAKYVKRNPSIIRFGKTLTKANLEFYKNRYHNTNLFYRFMFMNLIPYPLNDILPTKKIARITLSLIIINFLIFIWQLIAVSGNLKVFFYAVGIIPSAGFSMNRLYTFVTSMFVHADFIHLIGNMYYLWLFGDNIEDELGPLKFTIFYFLCGIFGGIVFCIIDYNKTIPAVGASGAISGILAAYLILYPKAPLEIFWLGGVREIPAIYYLLFWIIFQLLFAFILPIGIAYWAHIGGFLSGLSLIYLFKIIKRKTYV